MPKLKIPTASIGKPLVDCSFSDFVPVILFMDLPVGAWFVFVNKRVSTEIVGEHPTERSPYLKVTFELFVTWSDRQTAYAALLTEKVIECQPGLY
ncbi:MAG: hypothetical protein JW987_00630 [Anaerolineaceae bacterium]|nr:hypothetical protein [Anaerolineaceae bacterium]